MRGFVEYASCAGALSAFPEAREIAERPPALAAYRAQEMRRIVGHGVLWPAAASEEYDFWAPASRILCHAGHDFWAPGTRIQCPAEHGSWAPGTRTQYPPEHGSWAPGTRIQCPADIQRPEEEGSLHPPPTEEGRGCLPAVLETAKRGHFQYDQPWR